MKFCIMVVMEPTDESEGLDFQGSYAVHGESAKEALQQFLLDNENLPEQEVERLLKTTYKQKDAVVLNDEGLYYYTVKVSE